MVLYFVSQSIRRQRPSPMSRHRTGRAGKPDATEPRRFAVPGDGELEQARRCGSGFQPVRLPDRQGCVSRSVGFTESSL